MVRIVRMVRSLADRTFQLCEVLAPDLPPVRHPPGQELVEPGVLAADGLPRGAVQRQDLVRDVLASFNFAK